MSPQVTQRTRRVLALAEDISRRCGGVSVSDVSILIAMLEEDAGIAATVLRELNVGLQTLYALLPTQLPHDVATGPLPLAPEAEEALLRATDVMSEFGASEIGTEHLLLGIARSCSGAASLMLARMGISEARVRATAFRLAYGEDPAAPQAGSTDVT